MREKADTYLQGYIVLNNQWCDNIFLNSFLYIL